MGTFVIQTIDRGRRFSLVSEDGRTLAVSQIYRTLASCKGGIASVKNCVSQARVEDQTGQSFKPLKCPKFQVFLDANGQTRFRLLAKNGQGIMVGNVYDSMDASLAAIEEVRAEAADAELVIER